MSTRALHVKKKVEKHFLERARQFGLQIPAGETVDSESPDFLIRTNRGTLGIDVTRLFQPAPDRRFAPRQVESFQDRVICVAALEINPNSTSALLRKGNALEGLKRYGEAIHCYDEVLGMDLSRTLTENGRAEIYWEAWNAKGRNLYCLGRYRESVESYDKAIALCPDHSFTWFCKGTTLAEIKRFEEAVPCYNRAVELDPGDAKSWNDKAVCLMRMERLEEAILCCDKALTCEPPEVRAWYNKALAQEDLGLIRDAVRSYREYLAAGSANADRQMMEAARARLINLKSKIETSR